MKRVARAFLRFRAEIIRRQGWSLANSWRSRTTSTSHPIPLGWSWSDGRPVYSQGDGWLFEHGLGWTYRADLFDRITPRPNPIEPVMTPADRARIEACQARATPGGASGHTLTVREVPNEPEVELDDTETDM